MNIYPIARQKDLVIQDMPDEVLVFDVNTNKAHCLNPSAAFIWKACNGKNSVSDIVSQFESSVNGKIGEDFVWLALDQLQENALLEHEITPKFAGQSRRQVVKNIGLFSVAAAPIIASLVVPQNVMAVGSCACVAPLDCTIQPTCPSTTNCNAGAGGVCAP